jgi:uncharacterized membrane protein YoaK (UPF0700 family)
MRALPVWFVVGAFVAALIAAIVVGDQVWIAPIVVAVFGVLMLVVDRKVQQDGGGRGEADALKHRAPGR